MTYKSIIAIADKYNIPDDVLDIIFKYVYRNNIKKCTDKFTNRDFVRMMNRCFRNDSNKNTWNNHIYTPYDRIHMGRYMIKQLYPKSFDSRLLPQISFKNEDTIYIGPIKYKTDKREYVGYDRFVILNGGKELNYYYYNENEELKNSIDKTYEYKREDLINLLDFKMKVDEAFKIRPYEKFKKNMKTTDYIPLLMKE